MILLKNWEITVRLSRLLKFTNRHKIWHLVCGHWRILLEHAICKQVHVLNCLFLLSPCIRFFYVPNEPSWRWNKSHLVFQDSWRLKRNWQVLIRSMLRRIQYAVLKAKAVEQALKTHHRHPCRQMSTSQSWASRQGMLSLLATGRQKCIFFGIYLAGQELENWF